MRRNALIAEGLKGKPNRFVTLTCSPHWFGSPDERAAQLAKAWRLTVAAFRHRWPSRECEYLCVFEAHQSGEPHMHVMFRGGFLPWAWLKGQMAKRVGGKHVDVRYVHNPKQVAQYVAKYISKRPIRFGTCKRYWSSKGYLEKSAAQERRERNQGALFYAKNRHFTAYLEDLLRARITLVLPHPNLIEYELPPGRASPIGFWLEDAMNFHSRAA